MKTYPPIEINLEDSEIWHSPGMSRSILAEKSLTLTKEYLGARWTDEYRFCLLSNPSVEPLSTLGVRDRFFGVLVSPRDVQFSGTLTITSGSEWGLQGMEGEETSKEEKGIVFVFSHPLPTPSPRIGLRLFANDWAGDGLLQADPEESDMILSEVFLPGEFPIDADEVENKPFHYFLFPDEVEDFTVAETSKQVCYTYFLGDEIPEGGDKKGLVRPKKFWFKRVRRRFGQAFRVARLEAKKDHADKVPETQNETLPQTIIRKLAASRYIKKRWIQDLYQYRKYDPSVPPQDRIKIIKHHEIDLEAKTLILIAGTFKRALEWEDGEWKGSFKYLARETTQNPPWLSELLAENIFQQILILDHDTVLHGLADNITWFNTSPMRLNQLQFTQPVSIIAASRGGMIAKTLAIMPTTQPNAPFRGTESTQKLQDVLKFRETDIRKAFEIDKIVLAATGYSDYVEKTKVENLKQRIQILVSILAWTTGKGWISKIGWVLNLSIDVAAQLPGLAMQASNSEENDVIARALRQSISCLVLASDASDPEHSPVLRWVEPIVDRFLGEKNDFVTMYNSQSQAHPGILWDEEYAINRRDWEAIHGEIFGIEEARAVSRQFLTDDLLPS